ncbi:MAG: O-acetylhomoserine aminocarboxypropyltransferase [Candidatus Puniceispirillum sp. TMED52]|nr:O-acetylhomoserine aminocarboxypropyltransferase [SAR116 cluster bacterium]OUU45533.1 MAG: O-acetylhomoserine aminocarboxypropyltransferase [Candidatus Puniceispirillum sp. TMED52]|tara:strand:+ start:102 stop:1421 length:1320 start_codon:yes stop_codon:yes gene_type:complete
MSKSFGFDTLGLHAGFTPDDRHGSRAVPIHQTTSYMFHDTEHAAALYNLEVGGHLYTRISNPTIGVLENRMAALDEGVAAVAVATGMSAVFLSVLALCSQGDHIVASSQMYGGNINLLEHTMSRFGVTTSFVDPTDHDAIAAAIQPNTKMVFGEVIGNPGLDVMDISAVAEIAHAAGVPLVIDATLNTPYLMKPLKHGANIVIHSLTKWIGGHGVAMGGIIVDGGNFDWGQNDRFPTLTKPHFAFQGVNLWEEFGPAAFSMRVRSEGLYNIGPTLSPMNAFHILQGLETLGMRMERHMANTIELVEFLKNHDGVAWVNHPGLADHPCHDIAMRQMPKGAGSIVTMGLKGGREASQTFIEKVELASHLANVGDARTLVIHPGSTTHSHISADAMKAAGLTNDLIRVSVGLEDINDIKADFDRAIKTAQKIIQRKHATKGA